MKRHTDAELEAFAQEIRSLLSITDATREKIQMLISEVRERRATDRFLVNATTTRVRGHRGRR